MFGKWLGSKENTNYTTHDRKVHSSIPLWELHIRLPYQLRLHLPRNYVGLSRARGMNPCIRWDVSVYCIDGRQFPIGQKLEEGGSLLDTASLNHRGCGGCGVSVIHVAEDPMIVIGDHKVRALSLLAGLVDLVRAGQQNYVGRAKVSLTIAHRICALEVLISPGVRSNSPSAN